MGTGCHSPTEFNEVLGVVGPWVMETCGQLSTPVTFTGEITLGLFVSKANACLETKTTASLRTI